MAIVMRLEVPGGTIEQYEQVNEVLGIQGDDDAPDGLIFHVAGDTDEGFLIVDVWESAEKLDAFFEKAGPALADAGVPDTAPEIMPLHAMIPQGAGTEHNVIMETRSNIGTEEYDRMVKEVPSHAGDGSQHPVTVHVAAVADDGSVFVMDIWESPEAFAEFAERELMPVAEEGMEISPRFVPVHHTVRGTSTVSA
jgi:heme-degrading monooxygenase HmoA